MTFRRPTIYDVAREAGVSKSLVSLVLGGSPRVSQVSRAAVERAIRDLGYRPSQAASALASRRSGVIGVLIDDYANPWYLELLHGLSAALVPEGHHLTVVDAETAGSDQAALEGLWSLRAEGVVLAMEVAIRSGVPGRPPLVVAGTRERMPDDLDAVSNDDMLGGRLAARHLLELGHRVIGHLPGRGGAARARERGFVEEARERGAIVHVEAEARDEPATERTGYASAQRLLDSHPEVSALFAANDVMGLGALGAARDAGRDVPSDLSVVGYDNTAIARSRLVDLTTIDDDGAGVGREAAALLIARMSGTAGSITSRTLAPRLVVGRTTAAVRTA